MSGDPAQGLVEALRSVNFVNFRGTILAEIVASRPWASGTFAGLRHRLSLLLQGHGAGEAATAFLTTLGDREFILGDYIVADIAAVDMREDAEDLRCLTLEALTVEAD